MASYLEIFVEFFKIGLFMFGGGYGGIALLYKELVESKKWIGEEEFLAILGIAESTPGPMAVNSATWVGYALGGLPGSIVATLGVVLPAYLIIVGAIVAIRPYLEHELVKAAFRGINAAVVALILYAFIKLARPALLRGAFYVDIVSIVVFTLSLILLLTARATPIAVIGVGALVGLIAKLLGL